MLATILRELKYPYLWLIWIGTGEDIMFTNKIFSFILYPLEHWYFLL